MGKDRKSFIVVILILLVSVFLLDYASEMLTGRQITEVVFSEITVPDPEETVLESDVDLVSDELSTETFEEEAVSASDDELRALLGDELYAQVFGGGPIMLQQKATCSNFVDTTLRLGLVHLISGKGRYILNRDPSHYLVYDLGPDRTFGTPDDVKNNALPGDPLGPNTPESIYDNTLVWVSSTFAASAMSICTLSSSSIGKNIPVLPALVRIYLFLLVRILLQLLT